MTNDAKPYLPFSQRTGLKPIPPQLKLGEVSDDLRRMVHYFVSLELGRETRRRYDSLMDAYDEFNEKWQRVASDLHVDFYRQPFDTFKSSPNNTIARLACCIEQGNICELFDLVEFLVRHPGCSDVVKRELAEAFVKSRAAYRVFDNQYIAAIGTEEQAEAFERAIADAEAKDATAARKHLITAGVALRDGNWPGSVRESIHAVEAIAKGLAPGQPTLGGALNVLEKRGQLHGRLKAALDKLYAYSNADDNGVRHALVFDDVSKVDEADALFMLGACASFVSYLLARGP
jgi:hypothetical protein